MPQAAQQQNGRDEGPASLMGGHGQHATLEVVVSEAGKFVARIEDATLGALHAFESSMSINKAIQREVGAT